MAKQKKVNEFMGKLENTTPAPKRSNNEKLNLSDILGRPINYTYYKSNNTYPGEKYLLVGTSYNVEINSTKALKTRINAIATLLSSHNSLPVSKALKNPQFYDTLSHFERDWLDRTKETTMITKAYTENGNVVPEAFAVWRLILSPVKAVGQRS